MASRAQLSEETIRPALKRGDLVLADRFISSTLAYQGTADGMDRDEILQVGHVAIGGHWPDLTVVFDVDEAVAGIRLDPQLDRVESKGAEFHRRVREGYLAQARAEPEKYLVIDASANEDAVFDALLDGMERRFG